MTTERPPREVGSNLLLGQLPEALATAGSVLTDDDAPAYSARDMRAYAAAQVEYALNTWMEANDKATSALMYAAKEEERERWVAAMRALLGAKWCTPEYDEAARKAVALLQGPNGKFQPPRQFGR